MDQRPKIQIKLTNTDKAMELIGFLILIAFWVTMIVSYNNLPEQIPIHYNGLGEVDNYSKKSSIFLLPIIGSFLFIIITLVSKNPENFNYHVEITEQNAESQYKNSVKMMRIMKIIVIILFFLIDFKTIKTSIGKFEGLGIWFLPITLGIVFIPIIYFAYKSYKLK
tara:strand:- start:55 stop:552 length:498 start_codon:yes stop_codon:yes gene_type:complete